MAETLIFIFGIALAYFLGYRQKKTELESRLIQSVDRAKRQVKDKSQNRFMHGVRYQAAATLGMVEQEEKYLQEEIQRDSKNDEWI